MFEKKCTMGYEQIAYGEWQQWEREMMRSPTILNRLSKRVQTKINTYIPEKVHTAITAVIRQMVKGVLFGAGYTASVRTTAPRSLMETEEEVQKLLTTYRRTASVEGGVTGAGGLLLGLADFPILLALKIKMLFEMATLYGHDVSDYKERVYLLHIFQLAFSSQQHRRRVYEQVRNWEAEKRKLPADMNQFDWRNFQQEYRDYIDLAKMAQLIPGIGAVVGLVVNYRLVGKLGQTVMNAYRLRYFSREGLPQPGV